MEVGQLTQKNAGLANHLRKSSISIASLCYQEAIKASTPKTAAELLRKAYKELEEALSNTSHAHEKFMTQRNIAINARKISDLTYNHGIKESYRWLNRSIENSDKAFASFEEIRRPVIVLQYLNATLYGLCAGTAEITLDYKHFDESIDTKEVLEKSVYYDQMCSKHSNGINTLLHNISAVNFARKSMIIFIDHGDKKYIKIAKIGFSTFINSYENACNPWKNGCENNSALLRYGSLYNRLKQLHRDIITRNFGKEFKNEIKSVPKYSRRDFTY